MATLVTGATGFIGRTLVERLVADGQRVVVLSRRRGIPVAASVKLVTGDLVTGKGLGPELLEGVDRVVHCAGEWRQPAAMRSVNVEGTRRLLELVLRSTARDRSIHWVQVSSLSAYGPAATPNVSRIVTEESPEAPVGEYGRSRLDADTLVREAAASGALSCSILRPAGVIGAAMPTASLYSLISAVERRRYVHIGRGGIAPFVHVEDVVEALLACGSHSAARGRTYNLSSDCDWAVLVEFIARERGLRPPRIRVPAWPLRIAVRLGVGRLGLPLTAASLDALVAKTRYPADRIVADLGFRFRRPMPAAIRDLLLRRRSCR
jgi:nucleoside-diphosphate-sugar epimerase